MTEPNPILQISPHVCADASAHAQRFARREPFRHVTMVGPVAVGMICGFGPLGYTFALQALAARL